MEYKENELANGGESRGQTDEQEKPNAYRVNGGMTITSDDLQRELLTDNKVNGGKEGEPMGGQNFGKNNLTPSGDDKNNPSQNAGYANAYFGRTEPSEERPEDSNFKYVKQDGAPDYEKAQPHTGITSEMPKPEKVERGNGENDRPHKSEPYYEGTDDNDGQQQTHIPGPIELPEQQKVGEPDAGNNDDKDPIET